jgi:hypothetical protein
MHADDVRDDGMWRYDDTREASYDICLSRVGSFKRFITSDRRNIPQIAEFFTVLSRRSVNMLGLAAVCCRTSTGGWQIAWNRGESFLRDVLLLGQIRGNVTWELQWNPEAVVRRPDVQLILNLRCRYLGSGVATGTSLRQASSPTPTTRGSKLCTQEEEMTGTCKSNTCRNVTTARTSVRWVTFRTPWCLLLTSFPELACTCAKCNCPFERGCHIVLSNDTGSCVRCLFGV